MSAAGWFAQIHPADDSNPEEPRYFPDFATALAFVKSFGESRSSGVLKVYVPAAATELERQELRQNGAEPV